MPRRTATGPFGAALLRSVRPNQFRYWSQFRFRSQSRWPSRSHYRFRIPTRFHYQTRHHYPMPFRLLCQNRCLIQVLPRFPYLSQCQNQPHGLDQIPDPVQCQIQRYCQSRFPRGNRYRETPRDRLHQSRGTARLRHCPLNRKFPDRLQLRRVNSPQLVSFVTSDWGH